MTNQHQPSRRIAMLMFEQAQTLDITGPLEVFSEANRHQQALFPEQGQTYELVTVARHAGTITTSSGLQLQAEYSIENFDEELDTLLIAGGAGVRQALQDPAVIAFLQRYLGRARRIASICTGAFLLAATGALNGKRATTHWRHASHLQQLHPDIAVQPDAIYIREDKIYTSAGVTAGIDLALALTEEDLGKNTALSIARELIVFLQRPGGQTQFSQFLQNQTTADEDFSELSNWLLANLDKRINVESMAHQCSLSPRHFARLFQQKMRVTPAKYLEHMRLEKARLMLEQGQTSLKSVIRQCGFSSHEQMRRCFQRHLHINPQDYGKHF